MRAGTVGAWFQTDLPLMWPGGNLHYEPIGHLMDTFSRGGFSGSPVFVDQPTLRFIESGAAIGSNVALLGVLVGHYYSDKGDNAGIAVVVPIEFVRNLLDYPSLVEWRNYKEQQMNDKKKREEEDGPGTADSLHEEGASQFDRFQALTQKLVEAPKPEKKKD
jgi:hypothetical protein